VPEWHKDEIDRRMVSLDAGTSIGASWAEVRGRIAGKP